MLAILGDFDPESPGTPIVIVAAVQDHDHVDRESLTQIYLPPRGILEFGMNSIMSDPLVENRRRRSVFS